MALIYFKIYPKNVVSPSLFVGVREVWFVGGQDASLGWWRGKTSEVFREGLGWCEGVGGSLRGLGWG